MQKHSIVLALVLVAACTDTAKTDATNTGVEKKVEAATAPTPGGGGGLKLDKLGLMIDLPADSSVNEMLGNWMIQGGGTVVSVGEVKADNAAAPKSFEEAEKATADYSPKNVSKKEKLADGWNIQFTNEGGAGANYFVWIRRTIDGKQISCETTASSQEQADKAAAACLSLKKG